MMSNDLYMYCIYLAVIVSYKNEFYNMEKPPELMRCSAVQSTFISLVKVTSYVRTKRERIMACLIERKMAEKIRTIGMKAFLLGLKMRAEGTTEWKCVDMIPMT